VSVDSSSGSLSIRFINYSRVNALIRALDILLFALVSRDEYYLCRMRASSLRSDQNSVSGYARVEGLK
jgi:hypothetical protein